MKILHYTNCFFYLTTIVPYATVHYALFGMYAQIILGIVQITMAIIISLFIKKHSGSAKKHIINYWTATLSNLLAIFVLLKANATNNEILTILFLFIIPMLIASYFVYITYKIITQ